jgi:hypothetical protein
MPRSVVRGGPLSSDQCIGYIIAKVRLVADIPCLLPHSISPHRYGPSFNYLFKRTFLGPSPVTVVDRAVCVIHNRFSHLLEAIEFIAENGKPDERFEAEGILTQLMKPLTVCLLVTMSDVFSQFGPLSDVLQAEKCDLASVLKLASAHLQVLKDKRSDEYFHKLWLVMTNLATANNIEMSVPASRVRKAPSTLRQFVTVSTSGYRGNDAENGATAPQRNFIE